MLMSSGNRHPGLAVRMRPRVALRETEGGPREGKGRVGGVIRGWC